MGMGIKGPGGNWKPAAEVSFSRSNEEVASLKTWEWEKIIKSCTHTHTVNFMASRTPFQLFILHILYGLLLLVAYVAMETASAG
jgi:hypothetical protein